MSKEVSEEAQASEPVRDYVDPPPAPLFDAEELSLWSFYRAVIAEFVATLLFLYITVLTVIGYKKQTDPCETVGLLGVAWAFGGMIFILVYSTAGISGSYICSLLTLYPFFFFWVNNMFNSIVLDIGGHINPAVTFGLFLARKVSLIRAIAYIVAQLLGAICGVGIVKGIAKDYYDNFGGGTNTVSPTYSKGTALAAEIIGTFVLVYTVFSATDPKRNARDSHVPVSSYYIRRGEI